MTGTGMSDTGNLAARVGGLGRGRGGFQFGANDFGIFLGFDQYSTYLLKFVPVWFP